MIPASLDVYNTNIVTSRTDTRNDPEKSNTNCSRATEVLEKDRSPHLRSKLLPKQAFRCLDDVSLHFFGCLKGVKLTGLFTEAAVTLRFLSLLYD
jgi:hypothetical protein